MAFEAGIRFVGKGFDGEKLSSLSSDGLRWRWWRLYCMSDQEMFPGLVSKGLVPLTEMEIVGELYRSFEFNGRADRIILWRGEKGSLIQSGLVESFDVNGKEYLWHPNFHTFQDHHSRKEVKFVDKFYASFKKLNDFDKAVFILLLDKFKPKGVDLSVFCIPDFVPQFDSYVNKRFPLFGNGKSSNGAIKALCETVSGKVLKFLSAPEEKTQGGAKEFVEWYCKSYQEIRGKPYLRGGKDYKLASEMLKVFSPVELKKLGFRFLKEEDAFVKKAGYTIGVFKTMVNRLVMSAERRPIGSDDFSKYKDHRNV